jgi:tRNA uracil 4-sulfurtransferase
MPTSRTTELNGEPLVTIRPAAEITIKARGTRAVFLRQLRWNVKDALQRAGYDVSVWSRGMRIMARLRDRDSEGPGGGREGGADAADSVRNRLDAGADAAGSSRDRLDAGAVEALTRVFGIGSFSFVEGRCEPDLDAIVDTGARLFGERVKGRRYAVRCKRSGDHGFRSVDVERKLGAALNDGATVDLTDPEVTVEVALDPRGALFFSERFAGPGGLPLGTGGRGLALLSGGYDSVVAAWQLMRRGVTVDFVHFRLGEAPSERAALRVAQVLGERWSYGSRPDVHVIDLRPAVDEMQRSVAPSYWQVALKRVMIRAAEGVADGIETYGRSVARSGAARKRARIVIDALVTGESIGQVSSQTLANLRAIDAAADRPVLRPLIGSDKLDIIAMARAIGTAELSAEASEECDITPVRPVTASRDARLVAEEEDMTPAVLAACLAGVAKGETRIPLRVLREGEGWLDGPADDRPADDRPADDDLLTRSVPAGAVLLDCRPEPLRSTWAVSGHEVMLGPSTAAERERLDPDRTYVCFCLHGTRSRWVAERLRADGFRAFAFDGGMTALTRRLAEAPDADDGAAARPTVTAAGGV